MSILIAVVSLLGTIAIFFTLAKSSIKSLKRNG